MSNSSSIPLDNTGEVSIFLQYIFGGQYHIIIKDNKGNILFNPSGFNLPENVRKIEINGEKIANINNSFYKIETDTINQKGQIFEITKISDYTSIMNAIKILQSDDKTGALRPVQFTREINTLRKSSTQNSIPFCLVMIDIDNFKSINDSYGHAYGDSVLREVSKILSMILRKDDVIGRFGGDEFILALSQAKPKDVIELFNKRIFSKLKDELKIGISAGVKEYNDLLSYEENINMADTALYFAKQNGKGRIVAYEDWMAKKVFQSIEY